MADRGPRFTIEDGRGLHPSYVTLLFQRLRKSGADELQAMNFHGLRHCAASPMLASGADIAVVSKAVGHANIAITADVDGHLVGTIAQKAVDGAATLIAHTLHTTGGGRLMRVSLSVARASLLGQMAAVVLAWRNR